MAPSVSASSRTASTVGRCRRSRFCASRNAATAILVGRIQDRGRGSAARQGLTRQPQRREAVLVGRLERQRARAARDRAAAWARSCGAGQASATAIGVRMSGGAICASTDPSLYMTRQCTIDCGWTTTPSWSAPTGNRWIGLDQLQALVHQRGAVDGDLAAHRPVGVLQGLLGRGGFASRPVPGAERPARRGQHDLLDVESA